MGSVPDPTELGFAQDELCARPCHSTPGWGGEKEALRVLHKLRSDFLGNRRATELNGISKLLPWLVTHTISFLLSKTCLLLVSTVCFLNKILNSMTAGIHLSPYQNFATYFFFVYDVNVI